jgi:hypothetical protein
MVRPIMRTQLKTALLLSLISLFFVPKKGTAQTSAFESPVRFDPQMSEPMRKQFKGDLQVLFAIVSDGQSPLNQEVFGQASGEAYRVWFSGRIYSAAVDLSARSGIIAYVDPERFPPHYQAGPAKPQPSYPSTGGSDSFGTDLPPDGHP